MKLIMYGSEICPDCVKAKEVLVNFHNIELDYRNITEKTSILKEFLSYRDHDTIFSDVIKNGKIGIPFFISEDGTKTFDLSDIIDIDIPKTAQTKNACSIDGKGFC